MKVAISKRAAGRGICGLAERVRLIHRIHVIHRLDSKDSVWCDSERRVMQDFRGRRAALRKRSGVRGHDHRGSGEHPQGWTFAEADGTGGKGRSARRKPNPLSWNIRRNRSLRAKEPRRGPGTAAMPEREPGSEVDRSCKTSVEVRSGNRARPQGINRNPRDRPGPKGSGRNPFPGKRLCPHRLRTRP